MARKLFTLALTEVRLRFNHPLSLVFFIVLPIAFTAVMGGAMGTLLPDAQDPRAPVALVDEDRELLAAELVAALAASEALDLQALPAGPAQQALLDNDVAAVIRIPPGFTAELLAGRQVIVSLATAVDNRAPAIEQALQAAAARAGSLVAITRAGTAEAGQLAPFASDTERRAYFVNVLAATEKSLASPAAIVATSQRTEAGHQPAGGFAQSSAGQLVAWTLLTFLQGSVTLVDERIRGTLRRLVMAPLSKATILGGKFLGRYALGLAQMVLLIVVGWAVFRVDWGRDPLALALVALSFALAATSLGLMLSALVQTRAQAASASIALALLLSTAGSAWWPMDISPPAYQAVIKIFPSTWAVLGFTDVIARGAGVADVWPASAVLLLFAIVFFAVGLWRFRYE